MIDPTNSLQIDLSPKPPKPPRLSRLLIIPMLGALSLMIIFLDTFRELSVQTTASIATGVFFGTLAVVYVALDRDIWTFPFIYSLVLGLFHFGIIVPFALGLVTDEDIVHGHIWWDRTTTPYAIGVACVGYLSVGAGATLVASLTRPAVAKQVSEESLPDKKAALIVGALLLVGSVVTWFYVTIGSGGVSLLFAPYNVYLDATSGRSVLQFVWFGIGVGLCILAGQGPSKLRNFGLACFGLFVLFALPIGLRGEVLFSLAAASVISAKYRWMPSPKLALMGGVGLLFLISLFGEIRRVGFGGALSGQLAPSVAEGVAELGHSFRPVTEVVTWHLAYGESLINGASYWAPIDRAICSLANPLACTPAVEDERLLNVLMTNRVGTWGFSSIAEAYWNFGVLGVALIMLLIGAITAVLNVWAVGSLREALAGVIMVELLINVRNAFTAVPSHIVLGLIVVSAIWILGTILRNKSTPEQGEIRFSSQSTGQGI